MLASCSQCCSQRRELRELRAGVAGNVAPPSPPAPGNVAPASPPAPGIVAPASPPAPGEVASPFPLALGEVASHFPPAPGKVASLARLARLNRSVRSTAPAPRSCSPSRFAPQSARRGCSVSRLGFPPRSARARSSTTTTSLTPRATPAAPAAWHGLAPRQSMPPARIGRRARRRGGSSRRGYRRNGAPGGVDWRKLTTRLPPQWWRLAQRQRDARSAQCVYIHRARRLDLGAGTNALTRAAARYISPHCASLSGELPQRQPPKDCMLGRYRAQLTTRLPPHWRPAAGCWI